jgi:hypothetical protein
VLAPVHVLLPEPEEGVRDDAGVCGVGEASVDEGDSKGADQATKAKATEANVRVPGPDHAIVVPEQQTAQPVCLSQSLRS